MKQLRPKVKKGKQKPAGGFLRQRKKALLLSLLGAAGFILAGMVYFHQGGPEEISPSSVTSTSSSGWRLAAHNLAPASGGKILILSPLPLTVENDISAFSGGSESSSPGDLYEWERNGAIIPGEHSSKLNKSQLKKGDKIKVSLLKNGGTETAVSNPAVVENALPKITSIKIEPSLPTRRDTLMIKVEGSDADGDSITYSYRWTKEDGSVIGNEPSISGSLLNKKDKIMVEVTPFDGEANGSPMRASVMMANAQPKITSAPTPFSGKEYIYQVTAEDADQDIITFSLSKAPVGMTIDSKTGLIKWTFTEKDAGNYPVEIKVSDPEGDGDIQSFLLPLSFTTTVPTPSAIP